MQQEASNNVKGIEQQHKRIGIVAQDEPSNNAKRIKQRCKKIGTTTQEELSSNARKAKQQHEEEGDLILLLNILLIQSLVIILIQDNSFGQNLCFKSLGNATPF
jgi:hypothetical protein